MLWIKMFSNIGWFTVSIFVNSLIAFICMRKVGVSNLVNLFVGWYTPTPRETIQLNGGRLQLSQFIRYLVHPYP